MKSASDFDRSSTETAWRPTGSLAVLKKRAQLLRSIRTFFDHTDVLEIETPTLWQGNVPDPEVTGLLLRDGQAGVEHALHLQTSPELAMKCFVAAEEVSCFQICKAFRLGERGRRHNPEFTLLEWYRVGWDSDRLITEVIALVQASARTLGVAHQPLPVNQTAYRELFQVHCSLDPARASDQEMIDCALAHGAPEVDRDGALSFLMTHQIEPTFVDQGITVVHRYPAEQAALARHIHDHDGVLVADRFEVYLGQLELANGYGELTDPDQQRARFARDHQQRDARGLPSAGSQQHLLDAMTKGLPRCSGVAMGVDRLLMALSGATDLGSVVTYR